MTNYGCNLCLQYLSNLAAAASIWRTPRTIDTIKGIFEKHINEKPMYRKKSSIFHKTDWQRVEECVTIQLDNVNLPQKLKTILYLAVLPMGIRIRLFLEDTAMKLTAYGTLENFKKDMDYYLENIRWTCCGTIDTIGIFRQRYCDEIIQNDYFMWCEACIYCQEDCVRHLWNCMSVELKDNTVSKVNSYVKPEFIPIACWQQYLEGNLPTFLRRLEDEHRFGLEHTSVVEDMLIISAALALPAAVKYYWRQLSPEQRHENLSRIFAPLLLIFTQYNCSVHQTRNSQGCCDIVAFIVDELTDEQIREFMSGVYFDGLIQLVEWPWQDLFLQKLNSIWHLLQSDNYRTLLGHLIYLMSKEEMAQRPNNYRDIFIDLWEKSSIDFKESMRVNTMRFFRNLAVIDVPLVRLIINDPNVHITAMDFVKISRRYFNDLISDGNYEKVENCVQQLGITEKQKKTWLDSIDATFLCNSLLRKNSDWQKVDKCLNWRFSGNLEKIERWKEYIKCRLTVESCD